MESLIFPPLLLLLLFFFNSRLLTFEREKKRLQGQEYIRIKTRTTKLVILQLISWMEKSLRYRVLIF